MINDNPILIINQFNDQSIGVLLMLTKYSLHCEKWVEVKNPWLADNGDGWVVFKILCLVTLTDLAFSWAGFPHNKKTTPEHFWLITSMTASVNFCQPHFAWEFGLLSSTVKEAFNRKTPCLAHFERSPWFGFLKSIFSSVYKFL